MALLQLGLGIATILSGVDIALATAHQAGAVLLLTTLIVVRHRAIASPARPVSAIVGAWTEATRSLVGGSDPGRQRWERPARG